VNRIYTDVAVFDVKPEGLAVREIYSDIDFDALQKLAGVALIDATQARRAA
jgi:3-oxoadipate CoA-transferase beta subunit